MAGKRGKAEQDDGDQKPINRWIGLGVGAGIGSAAIAAALIYANRSRKSDAGSDKAAPAEAKPAGIAPDTD